VRSRQDLAADLRALDVAAGDVVMVHASVKAIGEIAGARTYVEHVADIADKRVPRFKVPVKENGVRVCESRRTGRRCAVVPVRGAPAARFRDAADGAHRCRQ
jgi:aminoglycoside N3'-acetyltransferase